MLCWGKLFYDEVIFVLCGGVDAHITDNIIKASSILLAFRHLPFPRFAVATKPNDPILPPTPTTRLPS